MEIYQHIFRAYEEIIIPNKENIIAYLSSGQIKYIGPAMAQKIYDAFGDQTLEILDKEPEKLLSIKGISTKRLEVICESYTANRAARDVIAFLTPYGITPNRAVQLFKEYRDKTITTVRTNPYILHRGPFCLLSSFTGSVQKRTLFPIFTHKFRFMGQCNPNCHCEPVTVSLVWQSKKRSAYSRFPRQCELLFGMTV